MSKIEDFAFYGASGRKYIFQVYPIGTKFNNIGGVYIFTRRMNNYGGGVTHNILYVGQTISLMRRITSAHPKWYPALRNGMNCTCVYSVLNDSERNTIENDLIVKYQPPFNMRIQ